ncbi:MAG: flippase-like domain-containing protein [Clostridium sp.]|nr:flippase-like domain-containing protein [Clostridium sp.]
MEQTHSMILKILLPVAIGLGVVIWMFISEFNPDAWRLIRFDARTVSAILLAVGFMALREFGLAWRFRALTDRSLSWRQAWRVTILCEFTSAITPTSAGGSAMSMLFMHREGIELGRGTTIMMTTLFLDELFMALVCPLMLCLAPIGDIFGGGGFASGVRVSFWVVIGLIIGVTLLLFWGTLLQPEKVGGVVRGVFRLRWLARWRGKAEKTADDIAQTGRDLRTRSVGWWVEAFGATALLWISRFLIVNALFFGFVPGADQLLILARQYVVWVLLTVSPTPGGSGVSEWLFANYYGDMISPASVALVISVFWRLISYYSLLVAGAVLLPSYIRGFRHK